MRAVVTLPAHVAAAYKIVTVAVSRATWQQQKGVKAQSLHSFNQGQNLLFRQICSSLVPVVHHTMSGHNILYPRGTQSDGLYAHQWPTPRDSTHILTAEEYEG